MVNYFRAFIIILLLTLVGAGVLGSGTVYADPSFEVPRIDDHFDPVEQGPAPQKTQPVSQNAQKEDGVWDWIKEKASGAWEWTKETASTYWEVSKKMPSYYWNKAKEGDWSAGAMAMISLIAVVVIGYHLGGWDAIVATYKGIVNMIKHPDEAFNHLLYAIQHPIETGKAMWKSISDSWKRDVINGDASSRSRWAGRVVGEIGLAIIGTKGADKAKHIATASKIAQKAGSKVPGAHAAKNVKTKLTNLKINGKMALFSGLAGTAMVAVGFTYSIPFVKPIFKNLVNCFSYQQTTGYYAVVLTPISCGDSFDGADGISGILKDPKMYKYQASPDGKEAGIGYRKIVGSIVKKEKNEIEYTNPAGDKLQWFVQRPNDIDTAINDGLNSKIAGKVVEAKVGDFVRKEKEVISFGMKIYNKTARNEAGDIDVETKDEIIEVKSSINALKGKKKSKKGDDQFTKYTQVDDNDFFNPYQKKVILYIDKPLQNLHPNDQKLLEKIKSKGVTIVNSLEELKEVLK